MKKNITLIIIIALLLHLSTVPSFAIQSATKATRVGNAPTSDPAKAGDDLFAAYKECSGKKNDPNVIYYPTAESSYPYALKPCLIANLKDKYPNTINAFDTRYGTKQGSGANINGCVECLPYVALAMSLATGKTDTFPSNSPTDYYNKQAVSSGDLFYDQFTPSGTNPLQPGDIGITITAGETNNINVGHMLMVKSFDKDAPYSFVGNESNWVHCAVGFIPNHRTSAYHFFRLRK